MTVLDKSKGNPSTRIYLPFKKGSRRGKWGDCCEKTFSALITPDSCNLHILVDRNRKDSHIFRPTAATISEQIGKTSARWRPVSVAQPGDNQKCEATGHTKGALLALLSAGLAAGPTVGRREPVTAGLEARGPRVGHTTVRTVQRRTPVLERENS